MDSNSNGLLHFSNGNLASNRGFSNDERNEQNLETCSLPTAILEPHSAAPLEELEIFPCSSTSSEGGARILQRPKQTKRRWSRRSVGDDDYNNCRKIRPYVSSVFRPLVKQTSVGLGRQLSEPVRTKNQKDFHKYGTISEEDHDLQRTSGDDASESESSELDSQSKAPSRFSLSFISTKQFATVCTLAMANLCSMIAFSCIAPFYPAEAKLKGLTDSEIGIIFGVFELVVCVVSLVLGKYMVYIGSKRMLIAGLVVTGIAAILFGFLKFLSSGTIFFLASMSIRIIEAVGDSCFITASFVISVKCFPGRISTVIGIMETFAGFGFTAGPMIGAGLYDIGGFQLPFLVLGGVLLIVAFFSCYLITNYKDEPSEEEKGMAGMLKIPTVWVMLYAVVICAISLSFLDPTLAEHLSTFNLSTTVVGLMFLLSGGIYTLAAPVWGMMFDKWHCTVIIMFFGASVSAIAMFAIGPAPFLHISKNLPVIALGLSLLGLASGALYIPTFQKCLDAVRSNGYEDSFQTYAGVSGIFQSAFAFGSFLGPTIGGLSVEKLGFAWTSAAIGFIFLVFIVLMLGYFAVEKALPKKVTSESPV